MEEEWVLTTHALKMSQSMKSVAVNVRGQHEEVTAPENVSVYME